MSSHHLKTRARPGLAAVAAALALTLLVPIDGTAQSQDRQTHRVILSDLPISEQIEIASLAETTGEESDELWKKAEKANEAAEHRKAGELFERSAQLRTPGDTRGMKGFEAAGTAYFNADKPRQASRAWEEAGNRALILGDVYAASENYMRAAVAAHKTNDRIRVSDMAWKAYYLTESPQLTNAQRTRLRKHIGVSPVSAEEAQAEWNTVYPRWRLVTMDLISTAEVERLRTVEDRYRALRDSLAGTPAPSASRSERATMTETIHFGHDRSDLSNEARSILRDKVSVFRAHPSMRIVVTGFASQPGTRAYNNALGLRRAEAARDYLVSQGIEKDRIQIATRGDDELVVHGPGEVAAAANRRGEFRILMAEVTMVQD